MIRPAASPEQDAASSYFCFGSSSQNPTATPYQVENFQVSLFEYTVGTLLAKHVKYSKTSTSAKHGKTFDPACCQQTQTEGYFFIFFCLTGSVGDP